MAGKHSNSTSHAHAHAQERVSRLGTIAAIVALVVLALGAVSAVVLANQSKDETNGGSAASACSAKKVRVAVAPELAATVTKLLKDADCSSIIVTPSTPVSVAEQLRSGADAPDLWVPDSTWWVERVAAAASGDTTNQAAKVSVVTKSLAASPVVIVTGDNSKPATWSGVLKGQGYIPGDPQKTTAGTVPLVASAVEAGGARLSESQLTEKIAPSSEGYATGKGVLDDGTRLTTAVEDKGVAAVSEQVALTSTTKGATLSVPASGTVNLDYPLAVTADAGDRDAAEAAAAFITKKMGTKAGTTALAAAGFRTTDDAPLTGRGVGPVRQLKVSDPALVTRVVTSYGRVALPTRTLAVFDVSGSMGYKSDDQTRIDLTTQAVRDGLALFPDKTAVGIWQFAEKLDGDRDYQQLVPIKPFSAFGGGSTQRAAVNDALAGMSFKVGQGTGLYDTTLAAFKSLQSSYDPSALNGLVIFTDGDNDDPGSISLSELVAQLKKLQDPARPVGVVMIGISQDANADSLAQIAKATGGASYIARDPQDIGKVLGQVVVAQFG